MRELHKTIVITDACVIINLLHVGRVRLLGELEGLRFVVPEEVIEEVARQEQRTVFDEVLAEGLFETVRITQVQILEAYGALRRTLGRGESACLALAEANGWTLASDERRAFRREALARIGEKRLLTTVDLYRMFIRAGLLTVEDADKDKRLLEVHRFKMPFRSFYDLLDVT